MPNEDTEYTTMPQKYLVQTSPKITVEYTDDGTAVSLLVPFQ